LYCYFIILAKVFRFGCKEVLG